MGFPWFNETRNDNNDIDWEVVGKSFDKYFSRLNQDGCCVVFEKEEIDEIYVFTYKDVKFPNEDNWGVD